MWGARTWLLAVVLALTLTACGGPRVEHPIPVKVAFETDHFVMANGLRVVLHREARATTALVHVRYRVGSKDDPVGRSGFAHFFEHLMFRGARKRVDRTFDQWMDDVGAHVNAETTTDTTDYHDEVPVSALPRALWLEADRMAYPLHDLDEDGFAREREVVKNERRERIDDVPYGGVPVAAAEALFGLDHPYGAPIAGRESELDAITLAEARTFARTYYSPHNATLVVCSPLPLAQMREMAMKWFATVPPGYPVPALGARPTRLERSLWLTLEADVDGGAVAFAWPAPATHGDGLLELRYALRAIESHAWRRLVVEKNLALDVDVDLQEGMLGSMVLVMVTMRRNLKAEAAVPYVEQALADAVSTMAYSEFGDEKTGRIVNELRQVETLQGRAYRLLHDVAYHGSTNAMQGDLRQWQAVKREDAAAAIEHFLLGRPRVTVFVRPKAGAPPGGRRRGS